MSKSPKSSSTGVEGGFGIESVVTLRFRASTRAAFTKVLEALGFGSKVVTLRGRPTGGDAGIDAIARSTDGGRRSSSDGRLAGVGV